MVDPGKGPGGGGAGPHTLFFFRNGAGRAEKIYFGDRRPPPLSQGLDDHPPPVSDGLDLPLQFAVFRSRFPRFVHINGKFALNISISPLFSVTEKQTFSYGRRNI